MRVDSDLPQNSAIPYSTGIIKRLRLLETLNAAIAHKLTLVSAPPGYGKTTLVAEFARTAGVPIAWHTVESRERDIPNLQRHSIQALRHLFPNIETEILANDFTTEDGAVQIVNYIRDAAKEDFFYVLDDVHYLTDSPAAEHWLRTLVDYLPAKTHLIIISRREVLAIGQDQLKFRLDEIEKLATSILGNDDSYARIQELSLHLEGWPAGTVLALQPLPSDVERKLLQGREGPEALFDALAESLLTRETPSMRQFLLESSVLARISPELCTKVLDIEDGAELITRALNRNLFLSRISGGLVYHRLFRDFLQLRLQTMFPERFASLNQRAAEWFRENNQVEDAFNHFITAGHMAEAVAITEGACRAYYSQGHLETLLNWREQLGHHAASAPQLSYVCARIYTNRYDYELAEIALGEAEAIFRIQHNDTGLLEVAFQKARLRLRQGETEEVVKILNSVFHVKDIDVPMRARGLHTLGLAHLRQGDNLLAVKYLEEAASVYEALNNRSATANVLQDLDVAYIRCGRLDDASACLQRGVAIWRSLRRADTLALALNNLGYHYHQRGDYSQARITLKEGLGIVERTSNRRAESYLLWSIGDVERDLSNFSEALAHYQHALELNQNNEPELQCFLILSMSTLYRWQNEFRDASFLAEEAMALAEHYRFVWEGLVADGYRLLTRAYQGEAQRVLPQLDTILEQLKELHALLGVVQVLGICAGVALLAGDEGACHGYFMQALDIAEARQNIQPFVAEVWHTPQLREFVEIHPGTYSTILHGLNQLEQNTVKRTSSAPVVQDTSQSPTCTLRVYTLGDDRVERDGVLVEASEWRANRAREFFYYILFMGSRRREEISLEFWPDSSVERVRSNFHTTLYRTRRAVGENVIVFKNELYMINPSLDIWCDAKQLEILTNQARLLPLSDARAEDLWRRAVSSYHGDFLGSLDARWISAQREIYNEMYVEALMGAGNCARARKDYQAAIRIYKHCLTVDPYREDAHRALMKGYADMGEKNQILTHYRYLEALFEQELGIKPSMQTIELAEKLAF